MLPNLIKEIDLFLEKPRSKKEYADKLNEVKDTISAKLAFNIFIEEEITSLYDTIVEVGELKAEEVTPEVIARAVEKTGDFVLDSICSGCICDELVFYARENK